MKYIQALLQGSNAFQNFTKACSMKAAMMVLYGACEPSPKPMSANVTQLGNVNFVEDINLVTKAYSFSLLFPRLHAQSAAIVGTILKENCIRHLLAGLEGDDSMLHGLQDRLDWKAGWIQASTKYEAGRAVRFSILMHMVEHEDGTCEFRIGVINGTMPNRRSMPKGTENQLKARLLFNPETINWVQNVSRLAAYYFAMPAWDYLETDSKGKRLHEIQSNPLIIEHGDVRVAGKIFELDIERFRAGINFQAQAVTPDTWRVEVLPMLLCITRNTLVQTSTWDIGLFTGPSERAHAALGNADRDEARNKVINIIGKRLEYALDNTPESGRVKMTFERMGQIIIEWGKHTKMHNTWAFGIKCVIAEGNPIREHSLKPKPKVMPAGTTDRGAKQPSRQWRPQQRQDSPASDYVASRRHGEDDSINRLLSEHELKRRRGALSMMRDRSQGIRSSFLGCSCQRCGKRIQL